jgi:hypothetical protein
MGRGRVIIPAALLVLAVGAVTVLAQRGGVEVSARRWDVSFEDDAELVWADGSVVVDGRLRLSHVRALGPAVEGDGFTSIALSPEGRVFLGTHGAILNVYEPATGSMTSLGKPVPDECPT